MASNGTIELDTSVDSKKLHDYGEQSPLVEAVKSADTPGNDSVDRAQPDVSRKARDLTTFALQFLSNASNETLGACFVGLGATTYFVLGRIGLVIIGVVGGVALHAAWDNASAGGANDENKSWEARKRKENGLDIVSRVLDWREKNKDGELKDSESPSIAASLSRKELDFSGCQPETKEALDGFTDAVIRDYVKWWYGPILPTDTSFPSACRQTLTHFLLAVSNQVSRKRPADTFLDFLTHFLPIVIVFLRELSSALRGTLGVEPSEAIHQYVFENPESDLANVLDQEQQDKKLKSIADDILQSFLDAKTYSCDPVKAFLREVLAGLVLEMTVIKCSRPEFINEWIIYALEDGETTELVQAIDAGVSGATANGSAISKTSTTTGPTEQSEKAVEHKRTVSRAEDAMEEAMQEAKRLSALIASEEANKARNPEDSLSSGAATASGLTPASSYSNSAANRSSFTSESAFEDENEIASSSSAVADSTPTFTSFDQIISSKPTALQAGASRSPARAAPMTLHNATVSIFDDAQPGEKSTVKSKPTVEYLLQIEPASSQHPGWMIARRYPDFETMHEVLRRIAVVSGVTVFTQRNPTLPGWKNKTKATLRIELEAYLRDALSFERLAESEGMKRFLEKDQGLSGVSPGTGNKGGFGFPSPAAFETMGKGMLDVLTSAPKGVAGGGKAVVGGVAGVFGGIGSKKQSSPTPAGRGPRSGNASTTTLPRMDSNPISHPRESQERPQLEASQEGQRPSFEAWDPIKPPPLPRWPSNEDTEPAGSEIANDFSSEKAPVQAPDKEEIEFFLPPPPSEIDDDYKAAPTSPRPSLDDSTTLRTPTSTTPSTITLPPDSTPPTSKPVRNGPKPLTIQETSVAVELFFATINELYLLSSAWSLRLALLNAAKSFLLRPGNPNLEAIRVLLQSTLIESQTTDAGIATNIRKTRENALPTEEELKAWPPPPSDEEKEKMRKKARKLLVEKGMPTALTSVMGAAASGEALGKVFDCLQVPEVARGLVFALTLQGVRAVTQ